MDSPIRQGYTEFNPDLTMRKVATRFDNDDLDQVRMNSELGMTKVNTL